MSPSSDLISLLAGYDAIDTVFFQLLDNLKLIISGNFIQREAQPDGNTTSTQSAIEQGILTAQVNAIRTTIVAAGGSFNTSLATYFMNREMFVSINAFIDSPTSDLYVGDAFSLIGVLAVYGKLEASNPYRRRLADFVDHTSMLKTVKAAGHVWKICLDQYQTNPKSPASQQDPTSPASPTAAIWSIASWLGIGSGGGATDTGDDAIAARNPLEIMSLTIATYEAIAVNKVYAKMLLECPGTNRQSDSNPEGKPSSPLFIEAPPFATFLSLCTFLFQNQHKSQRSALYARLCLLILRTLIESPILPPSSSASTAPSLLLDEKLRTTSIIVARQRTPYLPIVSFDAATKKQDKTAATSSSGSEATSDNGPNVGRLLMEGVLDALHCAIRYNMKRSLDTEMYKLALINVFQVIHFLRQAKFQLQYHWSELWKTLMSLIRFINAHPYPTSTTSPSSSATSLPNGNEKSGDVNAYSEIVGLVVLILSTSLIHGDSFLGTAEDFDDLFYKVIEGSVVLTKLKEVFFTPSVNGGPGNTASLSPSMAVLQAAINHYSALLPKSKLMGASSSQQLNAQQVAALIRDGYQTLSLHQYATSNGAANGNGNGNGNSNGFSKGNRRVSGGGANGGTGSDSIVQSPADVAAYLLYDPLPRLRESEERIFFKKMTRQIITDIQTLHSNVY